MCVDVCVCVYLMCVFMCIGCVCVLDVCPEYEKQDIYNYTWIDKTSACTNKANSVWLWWKTHDCLKIRKEWLCNINEHYVVGYFPVGLKSLEKMASKTESHYNYQMKYIVSIFPLDEKTLIRWS